MNSTARVLVVEDDLPLATILQQKLEHEGYAVEVARDGEQALSFAFSKHPDMILLDIMMPKISGMTVLKHLREDQWGKAVPVIILTNVDTQGEMISEIIQHHPSYYCLKADTPLEEVLQKVKDVLDHPTPTTTTT